MDDLIARKDVYKAFEDVLDEDFPYKSEETPRERIEGIKSAQQWIPCSERLPETTDEVLTTYIVNGNRKKKFVETATYYDGDEGYWSSPWDEYRIAGTKVEVIAWMPLPKPWEESEDKE